MVKINTVLFLTVLLLVACSCSKKEPIPTILSKQYQGQGLTYINEWRLLGPFKTDSTKYEEALSLDYLTFCNLSETNITPTLPKPKITGIPSKYLATDTLISENVKYKYNTFSINAFFRENYSIDSIPQTITYLTTNIISEKEEEVFLLMNASGHYDVYLNNQQLIKCDGIGGTLGFKNFKRMTLNKGNNFILVKIFLKKNNNLNFKAAIASEREAIKYLHEKFSNNFIKNQIVDSSTVILAKNPADFFDTVISYKITNVNGEVVDTGSLSKGLNSYQIKNLVSDRNYSFQFKIGSYSFNNQFLYGSAKSFYNEALLKQKKIKLPEHKRNIYALMHRYEVLLKPTFYTPGKKNWMYKIVLLTYNLEKYYNDIDNGKSPVKNCSGINFRAFTSKIDEQDKYYIVYAPDSIHSEDTLPLVLFIRPALENHHHFLTSPQMSKDYVINRAKYLVNKYRILLVFSAQRYYQKESMESISETDIFESIDAVNKIYNIDNRKIYLHGNCLGANRLISLACRYPDKFAAIGIYSPIYKEKGLLGNLSNIPIYMQYDFFDKHTPKENVDKLVKSANSNKLQLKFYFDNYSRAMYNNQLIGEGALQFFKGKQKIENPKEIHFSTIQKKYNEAYWLKIVPSKSREHANVDASYDSSNNQFDIRSKNINEIKINVEKLETVKNNPVVVNWNGKRYDIKNASKWISLRLDTEETGGMIKNDVCEGPIFDVYSDRFILVEGTLAKGKRNGILCKRIEDELTNNWSDYFFGPCIVKKDYQLTAKDIQNSNLVLVGDYRTNSYLRKITGKLPMTVTPGGITLGRQLFNGNQVNFEFV
ncbi:MAG: hypothetical protein MI922_07245, partial [Bacteroidales bacterium]|nr:hypothetical protein [Bacteroidales bacterium]